MGPERALRRAETEKMMLPLIDLFFRCLFSACDCSNHGVSCNPETGRCFCTTKGIIGDRCEKCDTTNHYHGDPLNGSCFYDLKIDYQFTFNLSKKDDRHYNQINFKNSPPKSDVDADFTITCSTNAKMNITMKAGEFKGVHHETFSWFYELILHKGCFWSFFLVILAGLFCKFSEMLFDEFSMKQNILMNIFLTVHWVLR